MSDIHKLDADLFTAKDLIDWTPPPTQYLISDGVLDVGGKMEIFGNEGSWKSGSVLHMAFSIATGRKWMGFKTNKANVLYLVAEGGRGGIRKRVIKYCAGTKEIYLAKPGLVPNEAARAEAIAYPPNVVIRYIDMLHLDEQSGINSLRRNVDNIIMSYPALPVLVVIDPMYKVFHHDLTKANEVSYFNENIDLLLNDYNKEKDGYQRQLSVVVVHHPRKAGKDQEGNIVRAGGSDESFGTKQFSWWFDTVFEMNLDVSDKTRTVVEAEFTKAPRNAEGYVPEYFRIQWDKSTLHPRIITRRMPKNPEDITEIRGKELLNSLE